MLGKSNLGVDGRDAVGQGTVRTARALKISEMFRDLCQLVWQQALLGPSKGIIVSLHCGKFGRHLALISTNNKSVNFV